MRSLSPRRSLAVTAAALALALSGSGVAFAAGGPATTGGAIATPGGGTTGGPVMYATWPTQSASAPAAADFNVRTVFNDGANGVSAFQGLVTDGTTVYGSDGYTLYRGPLNGSAPLIAWATPVTTQQSVSDLVLVGGTLYYGGPGGYLYRVDMKTGASTLVASRLGAVYNLATDGTNIYAADTYATTASIRKIAIASTKRGLTYSASTIWSGVNATALNVDSAGTIWITVLDSTSLGYDVQIRSANGTVTTVPSAALGLPGLPVGILGGANDVYVVDSAGSVADVNRYNHTVTHLPSAGFTTRGQHVTTDGTSLYAAESNAIEKLTP